MVLAPSCQNNIEEVGASQTQEDSSLIGNIDSYVAMKSSIEKKISLIDDKFKDDAAVRKLTNKYVGFRNVSGIKTNKDLEVKVILPKYYSIEEKKFLLVFYNQLANCKTDEILNLVKTKRNELNYGSFSFNFKNDFELILYTVNISVTEFYNLIYYKGGVGSEDGSTARGTGFKECLAKKVSGKDVGRSLVYGFTTGAIAGAFAGTVTIPGLGTAVGAIGGGVFGGAIGAVSNVASGYVWPAIDCIRFDVQQVALSDIGQEKYLTDDFFIDEMYDFDLKIEQKELLNDMLNTPESNEVIFIEK